MPRTALQDVARRVHVAIELSAAGAHPSALIQARTPLRAGDHAACVAGLARVGLVNHQLAPSTDFAMLVLASPAAFTLPTAM